MAGVMRGHAPPSALIVALAIAGALGTPAVAFAQDQGVAASTPPDIVKLKDGSLYRGTIMALVAGDYVEVRLPSGDTKRFAMREVTYAGAASDQPKSGASAEPAVRTLGRQDTKSAKVHFESDTPDSNFHIRTGEATLVGWAGRGAFTALAHSYDNICAPPCDATLPIGQHRLAFSTRGRAPIEAEDALTIEGPSTVKAAYVDNAGTRVAGLIVYGVSFAVGTMMIVASAERHTPDCTGQSIARSCVDTSAPVDGGLLWGGVAVLGLGAILGSVLAFQRDHVILEVTPMAAAVRSPALARREDAWVLPEAAGASGLALRVRF
jgi:hypothetical protein